MLDDDVLPQVRPVPWAWGWVRAPANAGGWTRSGDSTIPGRSGLLRFRGRSACLRASRWREDRSFCREGRVFWGEEPAAAESFAAGSLYTVASGEATMGG